MNVLLVNPVFTGRSELPPLGLLSLAAVLLRNGLTVEVLDLDIDRSPDPMGTLDETMRRFDPSVVGVTTMSDSCASALEACSRVKARNRAALTVLGGVHATVSDELTLASCLNVDVVVRGEGEATFREVILARSSGLSMSGIDGITHRVHGKVVRNRRREIPQTLIPIPFRLTTWFRESVTGRGGFRRAGAAATGVPFVRSVISMAAPSVSGTLTA